MHNFFRFLGILATITILVREGKCGKGSYSGGRSSSSSHRSSYSSSSSTSSSRPSTSSYSSNSYSSSYGSPYSSSTHKNTAMPMPTFSQSAPSSWNSYHSYSSSSNSGSKQPYGLTMPSSNGNSFTKTTTTSDGNLGQSSGFTTKGSPLSQYSMRHLTSSGTFGRKGVDEGLVTPSSGTSSSDRDFNAGFINPLLSSPTSLTSKGGNSGSKYISSTKTSMTTNDVQPRVTGTSSGSYGSTTGSLSHYYSTKSGINDGFLSPSTGYTTHSSKGSSKSSGFVTPRRPMASSDYSTHGGRSSTSQHASYTTSSRSGDRSSIGFVDPSTGFDHYGKNSEMAEAMSNFASPSSLGRSGKHASTVTTTTTTTKGGNGYNYYPSPLSFVPAPGYSGDSSHSTSAFSGRRYMTSPSRTSYRNHRYFYPHSNRNVGGNNHSSDDLEMAEGIHDMGKTGKKRITLYENANHGGQSLELYVRKGKCVDLPLLFNDKATSVNTHGNCFYLCEHSSCYGSCQKLAPGFGDENFLGFSYNDRVSSVRQC